MARERTTVDTDAAVTAPSVAERKGKRAHTTDGSVRPADGRWPLHDPQDESKVVRSPGAKKAAARRATETTTTREAGAL